MLKKGLLKKLLVLLEHDDAQLKTKALEVVQYFDGKKKYRRKERGEKCRTQKKEKKEGFCSRIS